MVGLEFRTRRSNFESSKIEDSDKTFSKKNDYIGYEKQFLRIWDKLFDIRLYRYAKFLLFKWYEILRDYTLTNLFNDFKTYDILNKYWFPLKILLIVSSSEIQSNISFGKFVYLFSYKYASTYRCLREWQKLYLLFIIQQSQSYNVVNEHLLEI